MGGSGSGRWDGHRARQVVEACAVVSIKGLKLAGVLRARPLEWRWKGILPEPEAWDGRVIWPGAGLADSAAAGRRDGGS